LNRFRRLAWIKAAMKAISAAVIGVLAVSIAHLAPHAAPDAFTMLLMALTVGAMLAWSLAPLKMIVAGSLIGVLSRLKPLRRLKDLALRTGNRQSLIRSSSAQRDGVEG